jgi:hypothetical protein
VTNADGMKSQESMRLHARSFMAFVLTPVLPISPRLTQLDKWSSNSPDFFRGRPIILDLAGSPLQVSEISQLITHLAARGVRVMALEGAKANQLDPLLPPLLQGGRTRVADQMFAADGGANAGPRRQEPSSLLIDSPIRSGAVRCLSGWRRDRARVGLVRRRDCRRGFDPCLRRAAGTSDGRLDREHVRAHLLQQ